MKILHDGSLDEGEEIIVSRKKRSKNKIDNWRAIKMDAIDLMTKMKPQELFVVSLMNKKMDYRTNCFVVRGKELSSGDSQKFKAGFKMLNTKGVLKRIKREHYIVSPEFVVPLSEYSDVNIAWNMLVSGNNKFAQKLVENQKDEESLKNMLERAIISGVVK